MKEVTYGGHRAVGKPDGSNAESWTGITCAHCDEGVSAAIIAIVQPDPAQVVRWIQCPNCGNGSVIHPDGTVSPSARMGPSIEGLPEAIASAYDEARSCMSLHAYTAVELVCRNILMHLAVEKKAKEGQDFASYISHLETEGYVTPPMKPWVDQIRKIGNKAAHELDQPDPMRAKSTLMFTAELLRLVYEMEHMTKTFVGGADPGEG